MKPSDSRRDAWNAYWHGSAQSSFPAGGSVAGDPLFDFWQAVFTGSPSGSRLLDLGTGNGAVLRQAMQHMQAPFVEMHGVDLADPVPSWHDPAAMPAIHFHGGVEMEQLPFPEKSFTLITSQFGIEYARSPDMQFEARRVMAPGGRMAFVVHHANSVITSVARDEARSQDFLLDDEGLLAATREILPWMARMRAGVPLDIGKAQSARARYNDCMGRLADLAAHLAAPDLLLESREYLHGLVAHVQPAQLDGALSAVDAMRHAISQGAVRTRQQIEVAHDEEGMQALVQPWRLPDMDVETGELRSVHGLLGWTVRVACAD